VLNLFPLEVVGREAAGLRAEKNRPPRVTLVRREVAAAAGCCQTPGCRGGVEEASPASVFVTELARRT
jgi:hypothetical protein